MTITFEMGIKKCVNFLRLFHFSKVLTKPSLKGSASLSNILHSTINFSSSYNKSFYIFLTCDSVTGENSKSDTFAFSLIFYDAWVFLINH